MKHKNIIKSRIYSLPYEKSFAFYARQQEEIGIPLNAIWDREANIINPEKVSKSANLDIYWICPANPSHRWTAKLYSISTERCGCPYCSGKHQYTTEEWINKAISKFGSKFDYSLASYVKGDSPIVIKCPIHGQFTTTPERHLASKNGCPYCSNNSRRKHPAETLASKYPELIESWDCSRNMEEFEESPQTVNIHGTKKYYWKCPNGKPHCYLASINDRRKGMGCAVCHGKQVSYDTSLACKYPHLLRFWSAKNVNNPSEVNVGGDIKYLWECEKHGTYKSIIRNMAQGRCCCPKCNNHKLSPEVYRSRIAEKYPNIILLGEYKRMTEKIRCRCSICGIEKEIRPQDLERRGCSCCKNKKK